MEHEQTTAVDEDASQQLTITQVERYIMDLNLLGTEQYAHITKLVIDDVIPSLIDGPFGLHNRLQFPPNLTHLTYTKSLMEEIPTGLPETLIELNISENRVKHLTGLPPNLQVLIFSNNYVSDLTGIPDSVTEIYCHYNPMTQVNAITILPPNLQVLACCFCNMSVIPYLPNTVTRLACIGNPELRALPVLPPNLIDLVCSDCSLIELPQLPDSLTILWCDNNQLQKLPEVLPSSLVELKCQANQLTTLPELPTGLTTLSCGKNLLTRMPDLPPRLEALSCEYNQLTWLPELPNSLTHLDCHSNRLIVFSASIPDTLQWLDCSVNPSLAWMPPISNNMFCMRLSTINIQRSYGYSEHYDVFITEKIINDLNKTHWTREREVAYQRLAVYRAELLERQLEITLNPDRVARLIRNGELGDIGTWDESLS